MNGRKSIESGFPAPYTPGSIASCGFARGIWVYLLVVFLVKTTRPTLFKLEHVIHFMQCLRSSTSCASSLERDQTTIIDITEYESTIIH